MLVNIRIMQVALALLVLSPSSMAETKKGTLEIAHTQAKGKGDAQITSLTLTLLPKKAFSMSGFVQQIDKPNEKVTVLRSTASLGIMSFSGGYTKSSLNKNEVESTDLNVGLKLGSFGQLVTSRAESKQKVNGLVNYGLSYKNTKGSWLTVSLDAKMIDYKSTLPSDINATANIKMEF